jgi:hypothetical protein
VAIVSPGADPHAVAGHVRRAEEARDALGRLGRVILEPLRVGTLNGVDYAVYPYRRPVRIRLRILRDARRTSIGKRILPWLRLATEMTAREACGDELRSGFAAPLARLAEEPSMPRRIRRAAEESLGRLEEKAWRPRTAIMHDDLNLHNVLTTSGLWASLSRMIIIDWERSSIRGCPFYDLVGMTMWMKLGKRRLRAEFESHCDILDCELVDARSYMLAALGRKYAGLHEPLPERVSARPGDVVLDDVLRSIGGDRRKLMVEIAAAMDRFDHLIKLETYLDARY